MFLNNLSSLSWQTGVLKFKNSTLNDVKKMLEIQYGSEILMYHQLREQHNLLSEEENDEPKSEIKLVLYIDYETLTDNLNIWALMQ